MFSRGCWYEYDSDYTQGDSLHCMQSICNLFRNSHIEGNALFYKVIHAHNVIVVRVRLFDYGRYKGLGFRTVFPD